MRTYRLVRVFEDRFEAGAALAAALKGRVDAGAVILALPRGGVPVAAEVAHRLGLPLDVFVVRKLGLPGQEELAMGAIASGGIRVMNDEVLRYAGIEPEMLDAVAAREMVELSRRERAYRGERAPLALRDRTVVLVDDGIATGASIRAAVRAVRVLGAKRVVVATPVAPPEACRELLLEADDVVCLETPDPFGAVGRWYRNFEETTDDEVRALL